MRSSRNKNNNNRKIRKQRSYRPNFKLQIQQLSERKILTESSHHFPLTNIASMTYSDTGIFTDGWTCTNRIPQGTANNQRIGSSATMKSVDYTFNVYAPPNNPDTARILVIIDHGPKGTVPLLSNMFDDPNNNLTCIAPTATGQYKILAEHFLDVGGVYLTRTVKFHVPLKCESKYFGLNADLASIQNNSIYIIIVTVNGQNTTECLNFWSSLKYYDI